MTTAHTVEAVLAGSAVALALGSGGFAYAANWPTSQLFGATLVDATDPDPALHTVALTYDDGPSTRNTPALLEVLAAAGATATFFLVGNHVRRHPQLARRIADAGHTIGNHTDMHPNLARKPIGRVRAELEVCQQTIADATGTLPALFRPPYGARRPAVLRLARELGLTPVLWNVTAGDWNSTAVNELLARVDRGLARNRRRGRTSNVLLHDASQLDGTAPQSRANTVALTVTLVHRPDLRFVSVTDFLPH